MSTAPNYNPGRSFADDEANNVAGRSLVKTDSLDAELADISTSINNLNGNLQALQRDDNKLKDGIIEPYAFSEQTNALIATAGCNPRGTWNQNTDYAYKDIVQRNNIAQICLQAHNSGSLFTQSFWLPISGDGTSAANAAAAAASASAASTSASNASTSASTATSASSAASTSATNAATSAKNASNSASSASTSASNASNSASEASVSAAAAAAAAASITAPRNYIGGLTTSTPGASTSISVAPGEAADSTNSIIIKLVSALTKTTAAWAVGNNQGGLDAGVIANNTGYHKFLIRRPDTGVVDVLLSLSATAPTLPANYTQFRRIGWGMTNGSGQWRSFFQFGDFFGWVSPTLDVSIASSGTSAVLNTLPVPSGVQVLVNVNVTTGNSSNLIYLSSPDSADLPPSSSVAPLTQVSSNVGTVANLKTNTSAQIRSRSSINTVLNITTTSWIDNRGKDA